MYPMYQCAPVSPKYLNRKVFRGKNIKKAEKLLLNDYKKDFYLQVQ